MAEILKNLVKCRLADKVFIESLIKEPVEDFSCSEGSNQDGFMGNMKFIVVKTKEGSTHHLIYKGVSHENNNGFVFHFDLFLKENLFYKTIAPEMEKLSKSSLPLAKMYGCLTDGKTDFLVLEDLRPLGYQLPERYPGLTFDETSMALQELGTFHAKGFHLLQDRGQDFFTGDLSAFLRHCYEVRDCPSNPHWPSFSQLAMDVIELIKDRITEDLANKMHNICSRIVDQIVVTWKLAKEGKYLSVICHGDIWANNILFKYSQDGKMKPLDVKFIDFQYTHIGSLYEDLYYFIFTSTSPEFRKEHLKTILDVYYEAFTQELQRVGTKHPSHFTREKFNEEFFQTITSALAYVALSVSFHLGVFPQQEDSERIENIDETLSILPVAKILGDFSNVCPIAFKNSERAMKRLVDVIHEFTEMNAL